MVMARVRNPGEFYIEAKGSKAKPGYAAVDWTPWLERMANRNSWEHGHKTVTAAGTAEQLPDLATPDGFELVVIAMPGNTGDIYLGNSKANAEDATKRLPFSAGNGLTLKVSNANLVWVDAAVNGEGVYYWVET